jgi:uncharacterized membrane protein
MKRKHWIVLLTIVAVVGGGAFFVGRQSAAEARPADTMARWLNLSASQVREIDKEDPDYARDANDLCDKLQGERRTLAGLLEAPASTAQAVNDQLDRVLAADAALQKRIIAHVIRVREHLDPSQRSRLMNLCAQGIRNAGHGEHHGYGPGDGTGPLNGRGPGNGAGPMNGRGMGGHGGGWGHGRGAGHE